MVKQCITSASVLFTNFLFFIPKLVSANSHSVSLDNPLDPTAFGSVQALLLAFVDIFQIIAVPIIIFFIIYAGFLYVTARGNPEVTKKASTALTYAIIGAVVVLGARAISAIVADTATSF